MRQVRRPVAAVAAAATLLTPLAAGTGQAAAPTKQRVGVDRAAEVSFTVTGRMIDVRLRPHDDTPNPLVAELSGAGVVVACKGRSPRRGTTLVVGFETAWPHGEDLMRGRLSRDVSDRMEWCVLEHPDGADIAVARKLRPPKPTATPSPSPAAQADSPR